VYRVLVGKPERKRPLEGPRHRGRLGLDGILGRFAVSEVWSGFTWLRIDTVDGLS
jgi:hypothetical protein